MTEEGLNHTYVTLLSKVAVVSLPATIRTSKVALISSSDMAVALSPFFIALKA